MGELPFILTFRKNDASRFLTAVFKVSAFWEDTGLPNLFFTAVLELTLLAWCRIRRLPPRYTEEVPPSAVRFAAESMLSAASAAGVFREEPS